ncbi:MAG: MarR family winged helix-turn-helix transcriptional regulator [Armatimonadota bacterium]|nr:MarR family winged helix-turn-helix transcriptional regulator [Armatimonadota bacterium]
MAQKVVQGLVKIALALRHQAWEHAYPHALTPTQAQILAYLLSRDPQGVRVLEIARVLAVKPPTASDAVDALVRKGLVRKRHGPQDRRAREVRLTDAGRRVAHRAALWPDFLAKVVEGLSSQEQAALLQVLLKVIRTLQERGEIPPSRMCLSCMYFRPFAHPDPDRPHHCAFVDAPFGIPHLRLDCPDHLAADAQTASRLWDAFHGGRAG